MLDALSETVVVNENGQRKQIIKAEAMIKQLVNKEASGDARSIQLLPRRSAVRWTRKTLKISVPRIRKSNC